MGVYIAIFCLEALRYILIGMCAGTLTAIGYIIFKELTKKR